MKKQSYSGSQSHLSVGQQYQSVTITFSQSHHNYSSDLLLLILSQECLQLLQSLLNHLLVDEVHLKTRFHCQGKTKLTLVRQKGRQ